MRGTALIILLGLLISAPVLAEEPYVPSKGERVDWGKVFNAKGVLDEPEDMSEVLNRDKPKKRINWRQELESGPRESPLPSNPSGRARKRPIWAKPDPESEGAAPEIRYSIRHPRPHEEEKDRAENERPQDERPEVKPALVEIPPEMEKATPAAAKPAPEIEKKEQAVPRPAPKIAKKKKPLPATVSEPVPEIENKKQAPPKEIAGVRSQESVRETEPVPAAGPEPPLRPEPVLEPEPAVEPPPDVEPGLAIRIEPVSKPQPRDRRTAALEPRRAEPVKPKPAEPEPVRLFSDETIEHFLTLAFYNRDEQAAYRKGGASPKARVLTRWRTGLRIATHGLPGDEELGMLKEAAGEVDGIVSSVSNLNVSLVDGGANVNVYFLPARKGEELSGYVKNTYDGVNIVASEVVFYAGRPDKTDMMRQFLHVLGLSGTTGSGGSIMCADPVPGAEGGLPTKDEMALRMLYRSEFEPGMDIDEAREKLMAAYK